MSPPRITAIQAVPPTLSGARRPPASASTQPPALQPPTAPGAADPANGFVSGSMPAPAGAPLLAWAPDDGVGAPLPTLADLPESPETPDAALSKALGSASVSGEAAAADLVPGDMLLFKVLSTSPRLALQRLGALPLAPRHDGTEGAPQRPAHATGAMQPDQTAMLRMAWAAPDAGTLANSWRVLVLEHLRQLGQGQGHAPTDILHAGLLSRWAFPIHAWSGLPLSLRLLPPKSPPNPARRPQAWDAPHGETDAAEFWGLRLSGELPGLGPTDLRTTLSLNGATLMILVQEDAALQRLREGQAHLVQAVHRAGWRLRLCQLLKQLPGEQEPAPLPGMPEAPPLGQLLQGQLPPGASWPGLAHGHAASPSLHSLPQALFRVAAEVLIALGQLGSRGSGGSGASVAGEPLSPVSR